MLFNARAAMWLALRLAQLLLAATVHQKHRLNLIGILHTAVYCAWRENRTTSNCYHQAAMAMDTSDAEVSDMPDEGGGGQPTRRARPNGIKRSVRCDLYGLL